jgi:uridine kinase
MKSALPGYAELRERIQAALGPTWRPLLIGIDGATGGGKSSTASWLAWQFGMPVVHLDFYTDLATRKLTTGAGEVARLIEYRIAGGRPVIVEGILLLEALDAIGRQPDFLVYVDGDPDPHAKYSECIRDYRARHDPRSKANFVLPGYDDRDELERTDP